MSYSISKLAPSKTDAKRIIREQMDQIATIQPAHKADADAMVESAGRFIDVLGDDDNRNVSISISGSVLGGQDGQRVTQVSCSMSLTLMTK